MLTFTQIYSEAQTQVDDASAATLVVLKRAINQGAKKFGAVLNREWRVSYETFNIVADQQFYQMPEAAIRLKSLTVTVGSVVYPLDEVPDEETWNQLVMTGTTSSVPERFFIRGADEFGIWPTPSASITDGGTLGYERRMRDMSIDDYSTGTASVTADSAAVTGSSTVWTAVMVDRFFKIDDPAGDGLWYRILSRTSNTAITLENTVTVTAAGQTYLIGEVPDIPEEYHESLVDYACYRFYNMRKDLSAAADMKSSFDAALDECKEQYSHKTTSTYFRKRSAAGPLYVHARRDYTV